MDFTKLALFTILLFGASTSYSKNNSTSNTAAPKAEVIRPQKPHELTQLRDPDAQYGKTLLFKQKKTQFRAYGPVHIKFSEITGNTILKGPTDINNSILNKLEQDGPLNCFDSQIHNMQVNGVVTLERTKIFKNLTLEGTLSAHNSIIDHIHANSSKVVLDNCIVHNLTIVGDINLPHHNPILELRGNTTVSGTIKFLEADGRVEIYGINTSVNNIENAIIQQL